VEACLRTEAVDDNVFVSVCEDTAGPRHLIGADLVRRIAHGDFADGTGKYGGVKSCPEGDQDTYKHHLGLLLSIVLRVCLGVVVFGL
jgi:hypothetical protein